MTAITPRLTLARDDASVESYDLSDRVVLVTGGGRGLGRVTVLALLQAGARVVLTSRDLRTLEETIAASGAADRARAVTADLTSSAACFDLAAEATAAFGRIDVLFNNAGIGPDSIGHDLLDKPYKFWEVEWDTLLRFHVINSIAPFVLATLLVRPMIERGWGRIVNDTTSLTTMLRFSAYGGSKASLEAHTSIMASDLEGTGVTANVLVPGGAAATRMSDALGGGQDLLIDPEVMGPPSVWLTSNASDGVTGRRFVASMWDADRPAAEAAESAGFPVAWRRLGPPTRLSAAATPRS